jgi:hypothetical protein
LEELAIRVLRLGDFETTVINTSIFIMGFVIALVVCRNRSWPMRRIPYFILTSANLLVRSSLSFAWLLTYRAMESGMLWLLMLVIFLVIAASGYVLGILARARSTDAFGNGKAAWIGLIPLLNLILLVSEPLHKTETRWTRPVIHALGTILGFALLLAALSVEPLILVSQMG